jgi:hypothetical protein
MDAAVVQAVARAELSDGRSSGSGRILWRRMGSGRGWRRRSVKIQAVHETRQ